MRSARANQLLRYVEDYASLLKEESRRREESKSIDNVKRGEMKEESKLNAGCNHALSSSDMMCSTNAGAKKKAILTISPIKKPEMKRKPESGSLILFCEAPITDKKSSCEWCANAGPWCNCLPHMKLCNAEIFANCAFCLRVVCGKHLMKCYCEIRISRENRFRRYREEMSEKLASNSEILRGVPGSSGSSKDNPRSGLQKVEA
jgi:hypothetical protein